MRVIASRIVRVLRNVEEFLRTRNTGRHSGTAGNYLCDFSSRFALIRSRMRL